MATVKLYVNSNSTPLEWTEGTGSGYTQINNESDASYIKTTSDGEISMFGVENSALTYLDIIDYVQIGCRVYTSGTNNRIRTRWKTHGTTYESYNAHGAPGAWNNVTDLRQTNPNTIAGWTWDEVNALEIGIEFELANPGFASCSELYIIVTYYTIPKVTQGSATNIEEITATGNGNITILGENAPTKRGICWNTTGTPTIADNKVEETGSFPTGAFTESMTGLSPGIKYYVRAYIYDSDGYSYSNQIDFVTKPNPPTSLNCVFSTSTQIDLSWTKGSGAEKTMVRRKAGSYPTSVTDGDQAYFDTSNSFDDTGKDLTVHYYYRAWSYVTDAPNSGYSDDYSEDEAEFIVIVTTYAPSDIIRADPTGVNANGLTEVDVAESITTRGFKYGLTEVDTWNESETGTYSEGAFSLTLTGLDPDTTYFIRAYAVGVWGTKYGSYLEFKTAFSYGSFESRITAEATASDSDIAKVGGERSLAIDNHLIQTQTIADLVAAGYLADYKDQKTKLRVTRPTPPPFEVGDTIKVKI